MHRLGNEKWISLIAISYSISDYMLTMSRYARQYHVDVAEKKEFFFFFIHILLLGQECCWLSSQQIKIELETAHEKKYRNR